MSSFERATLIWVCAAQVLAVLGALGLLCGVILRERSDPYEGRHRRDLDTLSTWQSFGRAWGGHLVAPVPQDLDERRALVEATAAGIIERAEIWNRELLTGPLYDPPPELERYEPSKGDEAYLALSPGALARTAEQPLRPHPARVETGELPIVELDLAGVT